MTVLAATCMTSKPNFSVLICPLVYSCPPVALALNHFVFFFLIHSYQSSKSFDAKSFTKLSVNFLTQLYYNSIDTSILLKACENIFVILFIYFVLTMLNVKNSEDDNLMITYR